MTTLKIYQAVWRAEDGEVEDQLFVSEKTSQADLQKEAEEMFRSEFEFEADYEFELGEVVCYFQPIEELSDYKGEKKYKVSLTEIK